MKASQSRGQAPSRAQAKRPKDRKDTILAVATRLFSERGYHAVAIDEIGSEVGITGPAVYRHYRDKEALLVAAAESGIDRLRAANIDALAQAQDPEARVAGLVRSLVRTTMDNRELMAVYNREVRHITATHRKRLTAKVRDNDTFWIGALSDLRQDLAPSQALFLVQALAGLVFSALHYQPRVAASRMEQVLTHMGTSAVLAGVTAVDVPTARAFNGGDVSPVAETEANVGGSEKPAAIARGTRREIVLATACRLFYERGFSGVGVDEICVASGIAGPGLYRHFKNKEEVLAAAFNRVNEQLAASVSRVMVSSSDSPDALFEQLLDSYAEIVIGNPELIALSLREVSSLSKEQQAVARRARYAYVADAVAILRQIHPSLPLQTARVVVEGALGLINGYAQAVRYRLSPHDSRSVLVTMAKAAAAHTGTEFSTPTANTPTDRTAEASAIP